MAMQKAFNNFQWRDYPSMDSPINRSNLMKLNNGLNAIDDRVVMFDTTKFNTVDAQGLIKNVTFDLQTGILTKYYVNGSIEEINTGISKLNMNLRFDRENQILYIVNADGTEDLIDLSVFITNYEFNDSDTIAHNVSSSGTVTSIVKEGSIEEKHLQPNYLADIKLEANKAQASAADASNSKTSAENSAALSQEYYEKAKQAGDDAISAINGAIDNINQGVPKFWVNPEDGILYHTPSRFTFAINRVTGQLEWGLTV